MYRLAVCEDEEEALVELRELCRRALDELDVEGEIVTFRSAQELSSALSSGGERFDLLCLDICMDGKNGMDLAHELRGYDDSTSIIFISSSDAYLREGYTVRAMRYLSKPVDYSELLDAIKGDLTLNQSPKLVTFRRGSRTVALPISDIIYVESRDHGIYLHNEDGERFFPTSLTEAEKLLPHGQFCRCHNSFLVNMSAITEIGRRFVTLRDGLTIPIGRRYYEQAQSQLVRYLNSNT